ncbi:ABC transporter permease [Neptunomonas antarctica]|uniref:Peptide/nickel transport system permease protein n=1 Tax=Neptunomonas antarctica TaxID=619304 RepID=A0A1N7NU75_9GAMM|nr:ABC transporter permease [Neptunomonas antarctica]SIT01945.1 peptide/nickel transport system permease protein [Neptunomonas antarctica]
MISSVLARFGKKVETSQDESYYTAGQLALIKARFTRKASGVIAGWVLVSIILMGFFAPFFSPIDPTIRGADAEYRRGAPQAFFFWDEQGASLRPFTYTYTKDKPKINLRALLGSGGLDALDAFTSSGALSASAQNKYNVDRGQRRYVQFFVKGWEYSLIDFSMAGLDLDLRWDRHLFGVEQGDIHLMGTDEDGKDVFSRTLHAVWVTVSIAIVALIVKLFSSLLVGGVSGYFGGRVDAVLMSFTEAVRVIPSIPVYLACAVALSSMDLTAVQRYFAIAVVIGALDFATLGRRLRTHILTERNQDYVLAAQLCGSSGWRIIWRHLIPSFTSYIIVDTLINFPYVILAETSLSFLGLGLTEPVNSLGVLLQKAQDPDIQQNMIWQFFPVLVFVILIMAFVFVGDALRDAADPYSEKK